MLLFMNVFMKIGFLCMFMDVLLSTSHKSLRFFAVRLLPNTDGAVGSRRSRWDRFSKSFSAGQSGFNPALLLLLL